MKIFKSLWQVCSPHNVSRNIFTITSSCRNRKILNDHHSKPYGTCPPGMKVTICGAAGCTGQPLALLLKQCPLLDEIALYDICATCGYGMELSHVDTNCRVSSYSGRHMLCDALKDSKIVVIVARDECDSFERNAPILTEITLQICNICPDCFTIVATEPVESLVPLVGEIQRLRSVYNPRTLLGCVELNCVRANTVLADFLRVPPEVVKVPVIGGSSPNTMVPVLSAAIYPCTLSQEQIECVTSCIMNAGDTVCNAKCCATATACFAGAYAVARTVVNVVKAMKGAKNIVQCGYVDSLGTCAPYCQFFANEVILGPSGVEKNLGIPELTKFENCLLCNCLPLIQNEYLRAVQLVFSMCTQHCCAIPGVNACYTTPPTCTAPVNWTCCGPNSCRDKHLASICREMTCKCGGTELNWRPREPEFDASRSANYTHQMQLRSEACNARQLPRSVRIEQQTRDRAKNPCS
ncbi:hypothetical protein ACJJTC_001782 [Scirpophaga incertulas]